MEIEIQKEQEQEDENDDFQAQLNIKIEKYFESKQYIESRDELDNFLSAIDLSDVWNSEDEKEELWEYIFKYNKDSRIDCEGAKKGINDFLNQDEEGQKEEEPDESSGQKAQRKESKENLLTRLSRLSNIDRKGNKPKSGNKLALNRYKQRAIDEYDCLDNNSLVQFNKIFALLKITKSNGKITFDELKEICNKHSFIKTDVNDIWKYLSYCVCEENLKNLEDKTELDIDNEIMDEVKSFITQKLVNEDIDIDSDNMEEDEGDKKENLEEMTLNLVEKIIKQAIDINENSMVLNDIKNEIKDINAKELENEKEIMINQKIEQIEEFIKKSQKENGLNINKLESLKGNILKITDNIKVMKDDYNELFKKYNSNQQVDINEETEKLLDENLMLNQIKENKEAEIENLLEEKKLMKKDYQNILMQYEDAIREKNELTQEISELKMNNYKLKGDYDKLLNDIVNKMDKDKKNKKNAKNDNANSNISYEDQVKEIKSINNSKIDDGEKISRKKGIFSSMTNEKLISYIMEIERINQTLSNEKNGKDQKIHELTQKNLDLNNLMKVLKDRNIDLEEEAKNLQKKIDNLNMDVQNNEMFRPSIAMNSQMRVSRLSKLNTIGINAQKFAGKGNFGGGKKKLEKVKLKDINKNQKIVKTPTLNKFENISMDLYGVKEVEDEEEDQENKKNDINNKKQEFIINQKGLNIENKKDINFDITSNQGVGFGNNSNKNSKMGIGGNSKFNFGNNNKNAYSAFNINNSNNININNKMNLESSPSGGIFFDGTNNDINLSQQPENTLNTIQSGEMEVSNINDINLSSGNNNIKSGASGDISSSVISFDIQNNNNIITNNKNNFETTNNNIFIKKEENNNTNNNKTQAQSGLFFDSKPQNVSLDLKKMESSSENIPTLKIDSLMGEMIIDENEINNKEESNDKNNNSNNNIKINKIQNENNINITNSINNVANNNNNDNKQLERDRINTVIINETNPGQSQNLENVIITGIQKEGFNIDNSSMKQSLSSTNSNNINIAGENNKGNNNINNIDNQSNKKESQIILDKSNENEIILSNSINNKNTNNLSESKSNFNSINSNNDINDSKSDLFPSINLLESSGKPIQYSRLSKVELDELRNNNYDYYSLFQDEYIQRKLKDEKDNCHEFNVYSDQIFLLTEKKHLNKSYIMITPSHIYLIEPKEMRFTHVVKKENILSFQISNKNVNIIMFQIHGGDNILIETLRRMDLLSYLREFYRTNKSLIKIKYEDKFDVKIKGKITTILVKDKVFSNLSNFDGAQKIGYLFLYKGTYIRPIFKEKLFILTSIGLLMFDEPNSDPSKLYPVIGSTVEKLEGTKYGRENCFQLTLLSGKVKIFATRKKREMDSWLKEFDKINKEFQSKMKQLDTINKKFMDNLSKNSA